MRAAIIASLLLCLAFAPKKDKHREQFVFDNENILTSEEEKQLDTLFRGHELRTTNEIVLVTTDSYDGQPDIYGYAATFGEVIEVGKKPCIDFKQHRFQTNQVYFSLASGVGAEACRNWTPPACSGSNTPSRMQQW